MAICSTLDQKVLSNIRKQRLMNRSQNIHLPVAQEPDWEIKNTEQDPSKIKSAADRLLLSAFSCIIV
jgi:hypothetical protein